MSLVSVTYDSFRERFVAEFQFQMWFASIVDRTFRYELRILSFSCFLVRSISTSRLLHL